MTEQRPDAPGERPPSSVLDRPLPRAGQAPTTRRRLRDTTPALVLQAAHPRQGVVVAAGLAVVATLTDRPAREVGLVLLTVLLGQSILGWHNDLVDRGRDRTHRVSGKPLSDGRLEPATVWFVLICAALLVVPLAFLNGRTAGAAYLGSLLVGLLGNLALREGALSWLPWAAAFALYPAFLSYGGWAHVSEGGPPQPVVVVLFALLGIGAHLLTALWGLVADHEDEWTYLPLRLGLRLGAGRLLAVASTYVAVVLVALAFVGTYLGLAR